MARKGMRRIALVRFSGDLYNVSIHCMMRGERDHEQTRDTHRKSQEGITA
jgi:hypothetical protein